MIGQEYLQSVLQIRIYPAVTCLMNKKQWKKMLASIGLPRKDKVNSNCYLLRGKDFDATAFKTN